MILVIGGAYQGKRAYVEKNFGEPKPVFWDAVLPEQAELAELRRRAGTSVPTAAVDHFEEYLRRETAVREKTFRTADGRAAEEQIAEEIWTEVRRRMSSAPEVRFILIADEIGNGIVPTDPSERRWREVTGRVLIRAASEAESVFRVLCGIGRQIR